MVRKIDISTPKYPNTFTFVDDEDFDWIMTMGKWYESKGYCQKKLKRKNVQLHRIIMAKYHNVEGMVIDHKNHFPLDNRKFNLRVCTRSDNSRNQISSRKYKGVYLRKNRKPSAKLYIKTSPKRTQYNLGISDNLEKLASIYDYAATLLFGEFAYLNQSGYILTKKEKADVRLRIELKHKGIKVWKGVLNKHKNQRKLPCQISK